MPDLLFITAKFEGFTNYRQLRTVPTIHWQILFTYNIL